MCCSKPFKVSSTNGTFCERCDRKAGTYGWERRESNIWAPTQLFLEELHPAAGAAAQNWLHLSWSSSAPGAVWHKRHWGRNKWLYAGAVGDLWLQSGPSGTAVILCVQLYNFSSSCLTHDCLVFKFNKEEVTCLSLVYYFFKANSRRWCSNTSVVINGTEPSVVKEIKVMAPEMHCTIALYAQKLSFFEKYLIWHVKNRKFW